MLGGYNVYKNRELQYKVKSEKNGEDYPFEDREKYKEKRPEKDAEDLAEDVLGICILIGFYFIGLHNLMTYGFF